MKSLIATAIIASTILVGCAQSSGHYEVSSVTSEKADMVVIGIPGLMGEVGTSFPVSETMSITAKHVHSVDKTISEHPNCDVKLIRHDNQGKHIDQFENVNLGDGVTVYGYSGRTGLPTEGQGIALKNYTAPNTSDMNEKCIVVTSSAGGIQGNSGGPVYHNGKIAGVMIAVNTEWGDSEFNSVFVPYAAIKDWLHENGIK